VRYKNPTPNSLFASEEGAMINITSQEEVIIV